MLNSYNRRSYTRHLQKYAKAIHNQNSLAYPPYADRQPAHILLWHNILVLNQRGCVGQSSMYSMQLGWGRSFRPLHSKSGGSLWWSWLCGGECCHPGGWCSQIWRYGIATGSRISFWYLTALRPDGEGLSLHASWQPYKHKGSGLLGVLSSWDPLTPNNVNTLDTRARASNCLITWSLNWRDKRGMCMLAAYTNSTKWQDPCIPVLSIRCQSGASHTPVSGAHLAALKTKININRRILLGILTLVQYGPLPTCLALLLIPWMHDPYKDYLIVQETNQAF